MNRSFKGVWIPKEIWLSDKLTLQEKVFLVEIDSLDNQDGCYASNKHFADFFKLSKNRCSEVIKSLEKKNLITIEYVRDKGKKSIDKRVIRVVDKSNMGIREVDRPIRNIDQGYSENLEGSNTSSSNTSSNTKEIVPYKEIIDYLNGTANKKYRHTTHATKKKIKERWNEGFRLDDFKKVIDVKNAEWKDSPKWSKFIRPDTLFGPKFEGYLNQDAPRPPGYDPNKDAF